VCSSDLGNEYMKETFCTKHARLYKPEGARAPFDWIESTNKL
jgi:hypothetical protein